MKAFRIVAVVFNFVSGAFGLMGGYAVIVMGWILVQCWVMEEVNGMHIAVFSIGAFQGLYALVDLIRRKQFPFSLLAGVKIRK